jgi:SAM-dependent methyltransferase
MAGLLRLGITLIAVGLLLIQVRKPMRWLGRPFLWLMNGSHSKLTDWGLEHVEIGKDFQILDVGCGGGRTVQKLSATATEGKVYGVDYSAESVAVSRRTNAPAIRAGRVEIRQASVSSLPFPEDQLDLVTAVETHYYWPDLAGDLREIRRVLKPGGTLCIVAEAYRGGKHGELARWVMAPLGGALPSVDELRGLLDAAGYAGVDILEEPRQGWLCAIGKKPAELGPR